MSAEARAPGEGLGSPAGSTLWALGLLGLLYFGTRLGSLSGLPMFLDEAVHIQWAERLYSEGRILRPIGAGRLLAIAAYGLALPFDDRLFAARVLATLAGAATLVLTALVSGRLFGARAGLIAAFLYVLSPFALVYDRLALSDGFLSASITAVMFATACLVQEPGRKGLRGAVAVLVGLAIVAKVSAPVFLLTVPLGALALAKDRGPAIKSAAIACAMGLMIASPMVFFFALGGAEIGAQHIVEPRLGGPILASTLKDMREWVHAYFGLPALLFGVAAMALLRDGRAVWLSGAVAIPFLLLALFSQPWSARYVLPTLPPLLALISGGIQALSSRVTAPFRAVSILALTALVALGGLSFDRDLLIDPSRAPFPGDDRLQFVTGWPSGYGVRELSDRLKNEAKENPVIVYVDTGGTRMVATSLEVLLGRHPGIRLVETDLGSSDNRGLMLSDLEAGRVFAILGPRAQDLDFGALVSGARVERVEVYERPGGEWVATLFRILRSPLPDRDSLSLLDPECSRIGLAPRGERREGACRRSEVS